MSVSLHESTIGPPSPPARAAWTWMRSGSGVPGLGVSAEVSSPAPTSAPRRAILPTPRQAEVRQSWWGRGPHHDRGRAPIRLRWWSPALMLISVLAASGLNATAISVGQRPSWLGAVASVVFLASWVGYLATTRGDAALRRLNGYWAAIIAGSALTASLVGARLSATDGQLVEAVLAVVSFLLAAPLYGITGLVGGEHFPLGMAGLAVACYLGLLAFALARRHAADGG
jgi:hypothetical protein